MRVISPTITLMKRVINIISTPAIHKNPLPIKPTAKKIRERKTIPIMIVSLTFIVQKYSLDEGNAWGITTKVCKKQ